MQANVGVELISSSWNHSIHSHKSSISSQPARPDVDDHNQSSLSDLEDESETPIEYSDAPVHAEGVPQSNTKLFAKSVSLSFSLLPETNDFHRHPQELSHPWIWRQPIRTLTLSAQATRMVQPFWSTQVINLNLQSQRKPYQRRLLCLLSFPSYYRSPPIKHPTTRPRISPHRPVAHLWPFLGHTDLSKERTSSTTYPIHPLRNWPINTWNIF